MHPSPIDCLLYSYGVFLITCGITAVIFIGWKAKTALISGGLSALISITVAHQISQGEDWAKISGVVAVLALAMVFAWRASASFFQLIQMIQEKAPDVKKKAVAFLIIALMCVVSVVVEILQVTFY